MIDSSQQQLVPARFNEGIASLLYERVVGTKSDSSEKLFRDLGKSSAHLNRENCVCDTFDWYAPEYQYHHTVKELNDWYLAEGFDDLCVLPPENIGHVYHWGYQQNLLIGSGVNVTGVRPLGGGA